jgi:hypothetical protein
MAVYVSGTKKQSDPKRSRPEAQTVQEDDKPKYAAPSHMGGSFSDSGYRSGRGGFGFRQTT